MGVETIRVSNPGPMSPWSCAATTDALVTRAKESGVLIRAIPGRPRLRASCGNWTNDDDIKRLRHVRRLAQS